MNIDEVLDFTDKAKQPCAYFDHNNERFRFQNLEIEDNKTIYKYLSDRNEIKISRR